MNHGMRFMTLYRRQGSRPSPWKRNPKEEQCQKMPKLPSVVLISHAGKIMLKILQARLQQYVNRELPDVQDGFRKGKGARDQIVNIHCFMEKTREFQKYIYFPLLTMPKPLTVWITTNCGKFFKNWEYQTT